jgi:hypothetical protein
MDPSAQVDPVAAPEPVPPAPEPLLRAGFLLVTGLILGLFLGAALFGHKGPGGRMAQRGFANLAQPRALASGEEALALPPGHPPVEGFAVPEGDSSGCPYLDSEDGAAYQESDDAQPLPSARPLRTYVQGQVDGPI